MPIQIYSAWIAWILLVIIVLVSPIVKIFKLNFLGFIMKNRRWIGIACGLFALIHIFVFAYTSNLPITFLINLKYWNFSTGFGWGLLALVCLIPLLLTSNNFSMKFLKINWKRVQKLTYIFFIATGIHIYLFTGYWYYTLLPMGIWFVLFIIAQLKKNENTPQKP